MTRFFLIEFIAIPHGTILSAADKHSMMQGRWRGIIDKNILDQITIKRGHQWGRHRSFAPFVATAGLMRRRQEHWRTMYCTVIFPQTLLKSEKISCSSRQQNAETRMGLIRIAASGRCEWVAQWLRELSCEWFLDALFIQFKRSQKCLIIVFLIEYDHWTAVRIELKVQWVIVHFKRKLNDMSADVYKYIIKHKIISFIRLL